MDGYIDEIASLNDRFINGALAGSISAALQVLYGYLVKMTTFSDRGFHDFGQVFIMFTPYQGILADLIGILSHVGNGIIFGVLFAYLLSWTAPRLYLTKGLIYGIILWHLFFMVGTAFKMPLFHQIPPSTAFSILIGSIIYGITAAYILRLIDARTRLF